ncbi:FAD-dependent monooxygenase [Anianabacter salinae]|uniref:FAD-dependent monooxygenase n=1 Tax=Anianabacter salinae TaxID=2851023 RepID=UPI00225DE897|nr:FAD-dependent monooxygenase [Anianabacter salinae]MBV0912440.1 FAD-dependent monooxygenase [Anianabacter salinae]
MSDHDVIIAGGGPVGMGLAIELGQRGIRVLVIERYPDPQPIPKGQNLTQRTTETLHFWGCEKDLRAARSIPADVGIGGLTVYKHLLSDYHYDWLNRASVNDYYLTTNERLPQYATEAVLRARAEKIDAIDIRYGWSVERVADKGDHVEVHTAEHRGEAREVLTAKYVVGCDGSKSAVRETGGIPQARSDHDKLMVLLVFNSMELHELLNRYPGKAFYNVLHPEMEGYWRFFGRVDVGSFFFHAPVPAGTTENDDFTAMLHEVVGQPFDLDITYVGFWDLRVSIAERYRAGRVFVAGDAAHSHPPYGGYGINTGFEDARNLGWKLAAVLKGWGSDALLDSYDAERRPVFQSTARDFIEHFIDDDNRFLQAHDPSRDKAAFEAAWYARNVGAAEVAKFEPNYEGSPIVAGSGTPSARGDHRFEARAGHHLAPQTLSDGANVFDRLGPGFTLLSLGGADPGDAASAAAARAGIPLAVVRDTAKTAYGAPFVLVRPDHYVAWTGTRAADAAEALLLAAGHAPNEMRKRA